MVNNVVRVHVVVHRAHSLPNTSFMSKQHPYVVATLLPFQWTQRTKICYSGGSAPEWGLQQDNHMYFEPKEGSLGQLTLRMELWNATKGSSSDKPIAMCHIEIPELPNSKSGVPEERAYRLADVKGRAGGMLVCTVHIEGIRGGKKKQYDTLQVRTGGSRSGLRERC